MTTLRRLARLLAAGLGLVLCVVWLGCLAVALGRYVKAPVWRWTSRRWRWCRRPWLDWSPWWLWRRLAPAERWPVAVAPERQRAYRSARERAALVELLRRRDGDDCQLCHTPLDLDCPQGDPWSEEVDHIVPFSLGGDCHVDNFQLAHRWCNQSKGARFDQPGRAA